MRMPTRAQALSQMMLRASLRFEAWKALTASDGCRQFVSHGGRPPSSVTPSSMPACLRKSASFVGRLAIDLCSPSVSGFTLSTMPGMAIEPSSFTSRARILQSAMVGSGTGPPHMPLCTGCLSAFTSTFTVTMPRSAVVIDGRPVSKLAVSVRTMASACSIARCFLRKSPSDPDPASSSPSMTILTLTGSAPAVLSHESMAATCTRMPALSSAAPRPKRRPSFSVGSNGLVCHLSSSPAGCTS